MGKGRAAITAAVLALALMPASAPAATDDTLRDYAAATWQSMSDMTDPQSGLVADQGFTDGTRSVQTSVTNIGALLWSTVGAEATGLVSHKSAVAGLRKTIATLEHMQRGAGGQFYNWYDTRNGAKLTQWPPTGDPLNPWLSSVDNGWLAVGLKIVANRVPELSARARALYDSMDFSVYYRPDRNQILFHIADNGDAPCCYDTTVSESRIATYVGIAKGELPAKAYFGTNRSFPDNCGWNWVETRPVGFTATYEGVPVYEGAYVYNGSRVVPSWGGSMFEALMPSLFVPEEQWAPNSWGVNHPLTVDAQIHHGMVEAGYGYWGFSPSNNPAGGYKAYGVDAIGMDPNGNPSDNRNTLVDHGWSDTACLRPAVPDPKPSAYHNGVVTPHAAFLALRYRPQAALDDLARLRDDFKRLYTTRGFLDSVDVDTGKVSSSYLSLDQGMIMAALSNALAGDVLRNAFATPDFAGAIAPVIGQETFNAGPAG
jgi:hypothetical protein